MAERRPRAAPRSPRLPAGVFQVRPGYYQARLQVGGQRVRETGTDPRALGEWYAEQKRKARRGRFEPALAQRDRELLRDYLPRWLDGRRGTVSARHWENHSRHAALVALYLGALPLRALRADDLRALYARLQAAPGADPIGRGLAPKTIRELHGTVRLALQQAVDDRVLERNEAALVRLPRGPRFAPRVLSSAELAAFWKVASGDRLFALWYLASLFPSRAGELRALRWEDVDARARTLTVRRSLERTEDAGRVLRTKAPKTAAGTRLVDLDPALLKTLQDHRQRQDAERRRAGARWVDHGLVFTTRYGTPLDGNSLRQRFRALLAEADVPAPGGLRFHDLRHTGVSALIAAGVPVPEVAAIAGHATAAVTNQLYAHAVRRARGTALGEAAAFHRAQLEAGGDSSAPDAAASAPPRKRTAERADTAERPGPEAP